MDWKPTNDMVIIEKVDLVEKTESGIVLPTSQTPDLLYGRVVVAGPGLFTSTGVRMGTEMAPGDLVVYSRLIPPSPQKIMFQNKEYLVIKATSIIAYRKG